MVPVEIIDRIPFDLDVPGMMATLKVPAESEDEARELVTRVLAG